MDTTDFPSRDALWFWRHLIGVARLRLEDLASLRAVSRSPRDAVDSAGELELDLSRPAHRRFWDAGRSTALWDRVTSVLWFDGDVARLPRGLRVLRFDRFDESPVDFGSLPTDLRELYFPVFCRQHVPIELLPRALETLALPVFYERHVDVDALPPSLVHLYLQCTGSRAEDVARLPATLRTLILGQSVGQDVDFRRLPPRLESIVFECGHKEWVDARGCPASLRNVFVERPSSFANMNLRSFPASVENVVLARYRVDMAELDLVEELSHGELVARRTAASPLHVPIEFGRARHLQYACH